MALSPILPPGDAAIRQSDRPTVLGSSMGAAMKVIGTMDREEYDRMLRDAREQKQRVQIANRVPWQTRLATRHLLEAAKERVETIRILAGTGGQNFFTEEMVGLLRNCADAGCSIRMLVWQPDLNTVSDGIKQLYTEGKLRLLPSGTKKFAATMPHFLLVGEDTYRQEAGHEEFDPAKPFTDDYPEIPARISFNDPDNALRLVGMFESLWNAADPAIAV